MAKHHHKAHKKGNGNGNANGFLSQFIQFLMRLLQLLLQLISQCTIPPSGGVTAPLPTQTPVLSVSPIPSVPSVVVPTLFGISPSPSAGISTPTIMPLTSTTPTAIPTATSTTGSCSQTLNGSQVNELQNNTYHLQSNEWGSNQPFSICTDGATDFKINNSQINNSTSGAPGAYPSLYKGCHWGNCTSSSGLPIAVSAMTPGTVLTSFSTTTVASGAWDDAYDIWFNPTSTTSSGGNLEMMIWLTKFGPVQPAGSVKAQNVSIGGNSYNIWYNGSGSGGTVSYVMTTPVESVSNLDLGQLAADAVARGYMQSSWFLIGVEAGFEPWIGGTGLSANSFSVTVK